MDGGFGHCEWVGRKGHFFSQVFLQREKQVLKMCTMLEQNTLALRSHSVFWKEPFWPGQVGMEVLTGLWAVVRETERNH